MVIRTKKAKRPDNFIERRINIGMITSTEYLKKIAPIYESTFIVSREARIIAQWCLEYFKKYGKAPGRHIEIIYTRKLPKLGESQAEGIELILQSLSDEFSHKNLNTDYLWDETQYYFQERQLEDLAASTQESINTGNLDEATEAIKRFQPISPIGSDIESQIEATILDGSKFARMDFPKLNCFLHPWLAAESLIMIYGWRERGKTWLGIIIAIGLTRRVQDEQLNIGPWEFRRKCGVLYVDGEMPCAELQKRYKRLTRHLPPMSGKYPLIILSANYFAKQLEGKGITIATAEWREALYQFLKKHAEYRILMLDNLSALTAGIKETLKRNGTPLINGCYDCGI